MSIKKDEWLTFEDTNKGLEVLKEKPLDYYSDVFSPWQTKQKLKIWREVEWNVWWWQVKTLIFNRLASVWTWVQSFTGFWFTPTSYTIQATRTDITTTWYPCFSDWAYDWTTEIIRQVADWYSRIVTNNIIRLFYTNQWWWKTSAIHSSFDSDGISLNFDFSAEDCYLVITAYK